MINEKGFLNENPPIHLLISIFEQGLTGILYLKNETIQKILYFNRGKFTWALSNADEDKLENILVDYKHIESNVLNRFTQQAKSSESMGKTLVENGIITLEELIVISKKQLSQIISSILFWHKDTFQFIKDTPPDRLVSLDLNIPEIIYAEIISHTDMSDIWKEIGSMQLSCHMCSDKTKMDKYSLPLEQKEILIEFHDDIIIEKIIAKYAEDNKNNIVKTLYFFLITGLLERTPAKPIPDKEKIDPFLNELKNQLEETDKHSDDLHDIEIDIPVDQDNLQEVTTKSSIIELESSHHPLLNTQPKSHRPFFLFILITVGIIMIGSLILWFLMGDQKIPNSTFDKPKPNNTRSPHTINPKPIANIENKNDKIPTNSLPPPPNAQSSLKTNPTVTQDKKPQTQSIKPIPEKPITAPLPIGNAIESFNAGQFTTAADIWLNEIQNQKVTFCIMLELDCEKESILHAYKNIHKPEQFFILNKKMGNRNCYYVMWGRFFSFDEASKNIALLPVYFKNQKEPPEIKEISQLVSSKQNQ